MLVRNVINGALAREPWARTRLAAHAGTMFAVAVGSATTSYSIASDGTLLPGAGTPTLTLTIAPSSMPALLAQPGRWNELVSTEGDAGLASTLADLALTLPWLIESMFAQLFGPIIGTRIADATRTMVTMPGYAAKRVGESVARYINDETRLAANTQDVRALAADAVALNERVDALTARIAALAASRSG
jgi:ubiquinone biosynthesis accessory factor UbiJ